MKRKNFFAIVIAVCMAATLTACFSNRTVGLKTVIADSSEVSADIDVSYEIISFGGYDWRVLEERDGKALLLSESVIEKREYHSEYVDITWADSDIRQYLNGEFYDNIFFEDEKARIAETMLDNNSNPWYVTGGGTTTIDKLFLLSLEEVVGYFGDSGQLANMPDDDTAFIGDEYNGSRVAYDKDGAASWWWLRSPGFYSNIAAIVDDDGLVYPNGGTVDIDSGGVRPALWLNL